MNYEYALGQCTNYLLDILDVPPGLLPNRAQGHWDRLFELASDQCIYHYLAVWMLEYWNEALPEKLKEQLQYDLEWNKARNIKLSMEIVELAKMFREAGIPAMFLKGAAGLVRGLYTLAWRYISDIDVMVREIDIEKTDQILKSSGFINHQVVTFESRHHLASYCNNHNISEIEVHFQPYHHFLKNSIIDDIWNNSIEVPFYLASVRIPSIIDHIWIILKKDLVNKIHNPRISDIYEIYLIYNSNNIIDQNVLLYRSTLENIPNLINIYSYYSLTFLGINFLGNNTNYSSYKILYFESVHFQQLINHHKTFFIHTTLLFASVRYFSGSGIKNKLLTISTIISSYNFIDFIKLASPHIGPNNIFYKYKTFIVRHLIKCFRITAISTIDK